MVFQHNLSTTTTVCLNVTVIAQKYTRFSIFIHLSLVLHSVNAGITVDCHCDSHRHPAGTKNVTFSVNKSQILGFLLRFASVCVAKTWREQPNLRAAHWFWRIKIWLQGIFGHCVRLGLNMMIMWSDWRINNLLRRGNVFFNRHDRGALWGLRRRLQRHADAWFRLVSCFQQQLEKESLRCSRRWRAERRRNSTYSRNTQSKLQYLSSWSRRTHI